MGSGAWEKRGRGASAQGVQVWRQPLQGLFTPDFARFTVRKGAEPALSCALGLRGLGAPWLRPFSGQSAVPRTPIPPGLRLLPKHLGPAASHSHFRFKKVAQAIALITETLPGLPRGGAAGCLQPGCPTCSLTPLPPPWPPPLGAAAVPRPLLSRFSTAGSENNGPLVLSLMFS